MFNVNPNNKPEKESYHGTLGRFTNNASEKFGMELLFKLADTNKDGIVDKIELSALDKKISEKSIFGDGVFNSSEFKDYIKEYNKEFKSDPSQMLEFSKDEMSRLKDMKTGISQNTYNKFKDFCNMRLGNADINTQIGINGKMSLDASHSTEQDQTGDCYFLNALNMLARENDGDISDYIRSDGKGGAVITYNGVKNFKGEKFEVKVSEREINFVRSYQKGNLTSRPYNYGSSREEHSILSKGDDDILAMELAEMKRQAYNMLVISFSNLSNKNFLPEWLKNQGETMLKDYIKNLSKEDKEEISRYILTQEKLVPYRAGLVYNMAALSDDEIKAFEFNDEMAQKINANPRALAQLKSKFPKEFMDVEGNEKETIDDEVIKNIKTSIKDWNKYISKNDMLEFKREMFEQLIKEIKVEDDINAGRIKMPEISKADIDSYTVTVDDLKRIFPPNKKTDAMCKKLESFLMTQFGNVEIKDDITLKNYHELIDNGGHAKNVLKALAGAESIETDTYDSLYSKQSPGVGGKQKTYEERAGERKIEIKNWVQNAIAQGYTKIDVAIRYSGGSHSVLFDNFDFDKGILFYYNPWDMNKLEKCSVDRILDLTAIKIPSKK